MRMGPTGGLQDEALLRPAMFGEKGYMKVKGDPGGDEKYTWIFVCFTVVVLVWLGICLVVGMLHPQTVSRGGAMGFGGDKVSAQREQGDKVSAQREPEDKISTQRKQVDNKPTQRQQEDNKTLPVEKEMSESNSSAELALGFGAAKLFMPLPKTVVGAHCTWQLRLNTVPDRIPETITEVLCHGSGESCGGSNMYSCKQMKAKMLVANTEALLVGDSYEWRVRSLRNITINIGCSCVYREPVLFERKKKKRSIDLGQLPSHSVRDPLVWFDQKTTSEPPGVRSSKLSEVKSDVESEILD